MPLEEIEKKLYGQAESESEKIPERKAPPIFQPWQKEETPMPKPKKRKWIIWVILFFLIIIGGVATYVVFLTPRFLSSSVELEIKAPSRSIQAGDKVFFVVTYKNKSELNLKDAELSFIYPQSSEPILSVQDKLVGNRITRRVGLLNPGEEGSLRFESRIFGLSGDTRSFEVVFSYQPEKILTRFENEAKFSLTIVEVPLEVSLKLPPKTTQGQDFEFSIHYLSKAKASFPGLKIKLEAPQSFKYLDSTPKPVGTNTWPIGDLASGKEGDIRIKGRIEGEALSLGFRAFLGFEDPQTKSFEILAEAGESLNLIVSPLMVRQTVNGVSEYNSKAGDFLEFQIDYENTAEVGIPEVIISAQLESEVIDFTSLSIARGSFSQLANSIIWNAGTMPELSFLNPGSKGKVSFWIKIKDKLSISSFSDINFKVVSKAKITSSKPPPELVGVDIGGESELSVKISGGLSLKASGFYRGAVIENIGPIPPKVGEKTTYAIVWRITNTSNDDNDVEVKAILPPHITWESKIEPSSLDITYNSSSGEVVWKVGSIKAGTGILRPVQEAAFQIGFTPSLVQVGRAADLMSTSKIKGTDAFTNVMIEESKPAIFTDLPDDKTLKSEDGIVVP